MRPVVKNWRCMQTGECCRQTPVVVMTWGERRAIEETIDAAARQRLVWYPTRDGRVELQAAPCPFLKGTRCGIYHVRPSVCRSFLCGRVPGETFEPGGPYGCKNLEERMTHPVFFKQLKRAMRKADEWRATH